MTTTLSLPTHLYHYTSVRGVEGILSRKEVWASLLHFMNDSREWLYALDLVEKSLLKKLTFRPDRYWLPFIADLSKSLSQIEGLHICVFSLTAMPNQLSQWRGYCPADGGYNLSFQPQLLQQHLARHKFTLRKCIYDGNEQQLVIDRIVNDVLAAVGTLGNDSEIQKASNLALARFTEKLAAVAPIWKHPDFSEEEEWRAFSHVRSDDPRMGYHIKGSVAVPHCVLDLQTPTLPFPIGEVTVGPNTHQNLAMRGICALADSAGVSVTATNSSIPLRNF